MLTRIGQLEILLRQSTVRIEYKGGNGTGFFVAPGVIITCFHVVESCLSKEEQQINLQSTVEKTAPANLRLVWRDLKQEEQSYTGPVKLDLVKEQDLARLTLTGFVPQHSCVYLDESVQLFDDLYSFGYPDKRPDGDPATFEVEGGTPGRVSSLKLKEGQANYGSSGSPLLNVNTGGVCGMVNISRNTSSDLGARAVPTATILTQFPDLKQKQRQFHARDRRWRWLVAPFRPSLLASGILSVVTTTAVIVTRAMGGLQGLELPAYDLLMRLRPYELWDERVQVVGITTRDLEDWQSSFIPHDKLESLLGAVQKASPRAIGIDIFRDKPMRLSEVEEKNYNALVQRIGQSNCTNQNRCVVATCWVNQELRKNDEDRARTHLGSRPPVGIGAEQLGFADVVVDNQRTKVIRRQLLRMDVVSDALCPVETSLSYQLATRYLAMQRIYPEWQQDEEGRVLFLRINQTIFDRLWGATGGYQKTDPSGYDPGGYQVMLNYRSGVSPTPISYNDVLSGKAQSRLRDRVVVIGYVSMPEVGHKDLHMTPYSLNTSEEQLMPGVIIHAHMVSQILSAALNNRPLIWVWSQPSEILWILGWALLGGAFIWQLQSRLYLIAGITVALLLLWGICVCFLIIGYWVPFVPAVLSLLLTVSSIRLYSSIQAFSNNVKIARLKQAQR